MVRCAIIFSKDITGLIVCLDPCRNSSPLCSSLAAIGPKKDDETSYSWTVRPSFQSRTHLPIVPIRRALLRSQILRETSTNSLVPPEFYKSISQELSKAYEAGIYLKDGPPKGDAPSKPPNPLTDPNAMDGMMSGMKTQAVMMVPQMVLMGWINFFFQGFVLSKFAVSFTLHRPVVYLPQTWKSNCLSLWRWDSSRCFRGESRPRTWMCDGCRLSRGTF